MQDCHSCDPGSIPGAGASLPTLVNRYRSAHATPNLDSINSRRRSSDIDTGPALTLDDVAHDTWRKWLFIKSAIV